MSVAGCYTDFHIDFGGTSVWYHILHGEKVGGFALCVVLLLCVRLDAGATAVTLSVLQAKLRFFTVCDVNCPLALMNKTLRCFKKHIN